MATPSSRTLGARALTALLAALLLALVARAVAQGDGPAGGVHALEHEGLEREYYLFLPPGLEPGAPLVVVLHGRGGTAEGMAALTGFDDVAARHGFAVVYPQGVQNQWNYVAGIEGYDLPMDDLSFLPALVAELVEAHDLDPRRVYVAGFSNGGYMAQRLACDGRDVFAAFATVGAAGYAGLPGVCGGGAPVSLLMMHGTDDAVVPFGGMVVEGPNGPVTLLASVQQTLSYWAQYAGCDANARSRTVPQQGLSPGTEVQVFSVTGCQGGHELELVVVYGGGHNWPGRPGILREDVAGRVNRDVHASEYIWEFFARQPPLGE